MTRSTASRVVILLFLGASIFNPRILAVPTPSPITSTGAHALQSRSPPGQGSRLYLQQSREVERANLVPRNEDELVDALEKLNLGSHDVMSREAMKEMAMKVTQDHVQVIIWKNGGGIPKHVRKIPGFLETMKHNADEAKRKTDGAKDDQLQELHQMAVTVSEYCV
ncbi:hypothetical protein F5878DRAFT_638253 [Lentinula raphanica]|uniref:Uncharacterized protein n=1 Tax=Lentinula raphanica TaxID=153919 RepID=A0AA38PHV6_9AGAR|nr:hypothetical protein F5878DRAFT_638253 [Lentinula raphanica]